MVPMRQRRIGSHLEVMEIKREDATSGNYVPTGHFGCALSSPVEISNVGYKAAMIQMIMSTDSCPN